MLTTALTGVGTCDYAQKYEEPRVNGMIIGCDTEETGGIGGNLGGEDKPLWGACEERNVVFDPETREPVYEDVYEAEQREKNFPTVCYLA